MLQRIARSDRTAIRECLAAYGDFVWALVKAKSVSTEEAERLTSEIFDDVWKYASRFDCRQCSEKTFISLLAHRRLMPH